MSWPQAQEYHEAIQNPVTAFLDAELKNGTVRTDRLGLPVVISGNFASVYQITTTGGVWAVRCFVREVPDSHRRYEQISRTLKTLQLPYTAPFEYLPRGIRVGGRELPIVKMRWMQGQLLNDYVAANLRNSTVIAQLAKKWAAMVSDLHEKKIAHCDLQHGNVLVVNHQLMLIDYDGMFVPAFSGLKANEQGHPNYQHPKRSDADFGPYTDHFSAWVIYAALRVLAVSPELFELAKALGRDDCLLFNRDDFSDPNGSPILNELRMHSDGCVVRLGQQLAGFINRAPRAIPVLDPTPFDEPAVASNPAPAASTSEWWREHIKAPAVVRLKPVSLGPQPKAQREMLYMIIASLGVFLGGYLTGAIGGGGYLIGQLTILLAARFRLQHHFKICPEGAARERFLQEVAIKQDDLAEKQKRLEQGKANIADNQTKRETWAAQLQKDIAAVMTEQGAEIRKVNEQQAIAKSQIAAKRRTVAEAERHELLASTARLEQEILQLQTLTSNFANKRSKMFLNALAMHRNDVLRSLLSQHPIAGGAFYGVSYQFKQNLIHSGIRTAAEVSFGSVRCVDGFGPKRTATMVEWRDNLAAHYQSQLPTVLPLSEVQRIEREMVAQKSAHDAALRSAQQQLRDAKQRLDRAFAPQRAALDNEERQIGAQAQQMMAAITSERDKKTADLRNRFESIKREFDREIATASAMVRNLEAEVLRIQTWQRDVAAPTREAYKAVTCARFVHSILTSKYQS